MNRANEPAFPIDGTHLEGGINREFAGLTVREDFAKAAMQGLLACPNVSENWPVEEQARYAVKVANALLAALKTPATPATDSVRTDTDRLDWLARQHQFYQLTSLAKLRAWIDERMEATP